MNNVVGVDEVESFEELIHDFLEVEGIETVGVVFQVFQYRSFHILKHKIHLALLAEHIDQVHDVVLF